MNRSPEKPLQSQLQHSIRDHLLGADAGHVHDENADHDHDHEGGPNMLGEGARALESVPLVSMGVDIGSSGTQIAFSRLLMRGPGEPLAMRRHAAQRQTLYLSPVSLTPFKNAHEIDAQRLRALIDRAFVAAGITPDDIETGVVILTGAAMARENARSIADLLAQDLGELVTATAGHRMEAMLAAYGSGAVRRSMEKSAAILNIDIGGGTTKLTRIIEGRIEASAALAIGGRQMCWNRDDVLIRCDESAHIFLSRAGLDWQIGEKVDLAQADCIADLMAEALFAALEHPQAESTLWLTDPLPAQTADALMFSGGVAEYVYGREARDFSDMGRRLGLAIRRLIDAKRISAPLEEAGECIRATALGASEFSVQMSGQTSFITHPAGLLPRRNLPVLMPPVNLTGDLDAPQIAYAIRDHRKAFGLADLMTDFALAFRWRGAPEYVRLRALADGIAQGLADRIAAGLPLYLMLEGDAALTLGHILRDEIKVVSPLLVIDGITLRDFDFVDIGRIRLPSNMVPVTIKSLLFDVAQMANE